MSMYVLYVCKSQRAIATPHPRWDWRDRYISTYNFFYASFSGPRLKCTGHRILGGTGNITEQCVYIYVHNVCNVHNVCKSQRAVDTVQ